MFHWTYQDKQVDTIREEYEGFVYPITQYNNWAKICRQKTCKI